jgi:hypothetical protein
MTRTVKLPRPKLDETKSRNVRRYVRAVLAQRTLAATLTAARAEVALAEAALTGGQKAEAERLLKSLDGMPGGGSDGR